VDVARRLERETLHSSLEEVRARARRRRRRGYLGGRRAGQGQPIPGLVLDLMPFEPEGQAPGYPRCDGFQVVNLGARKGTEQHLPSGPLEEDAIRQDEVQVWPEQQ